MNPTEAAFQKAIDDRSGDAGTRLAFADWLEEEGDERAEGYRMLGLLEVSPDWNGADWWYYRTPGHGHCLPKVWNNVFHNDAEYYNWSDKCRATLEDRAARNWLLLSEAERDDIRYLAHKKSASLTAQ